MLKFLNLLNGYNSSTCLGIKGEGLTDTLWAPSILLYTIYLLLYTICVEKEMATHSSVLAWRIPWTEEPGGLQSMGLQRVGQDWVTNTHTHTHTHTHTICEYLVNDYTPYIQLSITYVTVYCCCCVASVVSDSVRPHRQQPTRLPRPWDSPGKNTGVGSQIVCNSTHNVPRKYTIV